MEQIVLGHLKRHGLVCQTVKSVIVREDLMSAVVEVIFSYAPITANIFFVFFLYFLITFSYVVEYIRGKDGVFAAEPTLY